MRRGAPTPFKVELQELHQAIVRTQKNQNNATFAVLSLPYVQFEKKDKLKPANATHQASPCGQHSPTVISAQLWSNRNVQFDDEIVKYLESILKKRTSNQKPGGSNDYLILGGEVVGGPIKGKKKTE